MTIQIGKEATALELFTILHEMGHAVSYLASRDQNFKSCALYLYNNKDGHTLISPEYACAQFEEGFANFIAATALFNKNAQTPFAYCFGAGPCMNLNYNIEQSNGASGACQTAGEENRWEISTARFLWDLYDTVVDYSGDVYQQPLYTFIDTIHSFDNGTGNRQKNEPWNSALTVQQKPDGRSTYDYRMLYEYWHDNITSLNAPYVANCSPVGD